MKGAPNIKETSARLAQEAEARLAELLEMRAELDQEIYRLKSFLRGVKPFLEGYPRGAKDETVGLRQACVEVLQMSYEPLTATKIIDHLRANGFPIDDYKNPFAVVSTTLKRLVKQDKVMEEKKEGKAAYRWLGHP